MYKSNKRTLKIVTVFYNIAGPKILCTNIQQYLNLITVDIVLSSFFVQNPYVLSADPCGSSTSGSAISVAANWVAVAVGTETDGSILCPASFNSVVGIKPTVGLTSRAGVIPVSPRQDTIGWVMVIKSIFPFVRIYIKCSVLDETLK